MRVVVVGAGAVGSVLAARPHQGGADMTAKTQATAPIHDAVLRWNRDVAIIGGTDGVEHERLAPGRFARVNGMVVQLPATYETAGRRHGTLLTHRRAGGRRVSPAG